MRVCARRRWLFSYLKYLFTWGLSFACVQFHLGAVRGEEQAAQLYDDFASAIPGMALNLPQTGASGDDCSEGKSLGGDKGRQRGLSDHGEAIGLIDPATGIYMEKQVPRAR